MPGIRNVTGCALFTGMLAGAIFLAACGGGDDARETIHGRVIDVQTRTITEIESFSLRDEAGETWLFATKGPLEFTPSHLTQHMLGGEKVTVQFEHRAEGLLAVSISDYH